MAGYTQERMMARRLRKVGLLLALFVSAAIGDASAQPPPSTEMARSISGNWELSNADRDRTCPVVLRATPAPLGLALQWDAKCAEAFPFTRDTIAWTVGARDAIQFIDRAGKTALELTEVEGGLYEGERPGEGLVFLQNASSSSAEAKKPEDVAGDWGFVLGGKTVCQVALTATSGSKDTLSLRLKPNCDAAIARANFTGWRIDRGQLVLSPQRGEVWRFEEADPTTWTRIPEGRNPMQLVKQ